MIEIRAPETLGYTKNARLQAVHHFSFAGYQNSRRSRWGNLLSLNVNVLAPRAELSANPIDGVDVITIVRSGVLTHNGNLTGVCRTCTNEVELISAGPGIVHGYRNDSNKPALFVEARIASQMPIDRPERRLTSFPTRSRTNQLLLLGSGHPNDLGPRMRSVARVFGARLQRGAVVTRASPVPQRAYALPMSGSISINGIPVPPSGAAALSQVRAIEITAASACELLLIEVDE